MRQYVSMVVGGVKALCVLAEHSVFLIPRMIIYN